MGTAHQLGSRRSLSNKYFYLATYFIVAFAPCLDRAQTIDKLGGCLIFQLTTAILSILADRLLKMRVNEHIFNQNVCN